MSDSAYPARFVEFFGPCMWKTLHAVAFSYPRDADGETRKNYIDFYRSVGNVIPCPSCQGHYQAYMLSNPIEASDRGSLARWVYDLHDTVNKRNNKESPGFEEVERDYNGWSQSNNAQFNGLSEKAKLRALADPFLNRGITAKKEAAFGLSPTMDAASLTRYAVIGAILVLVLLAMRRHRKQQEAEV